MRREELSFRRCVLLSIICSGLSSLPIGLIPAAQANESGILAIGIPVAFWLGLAGEQLFIWRANSLRKAWGEKVDPCLGKSDARPGAMAFFKSPEGTIADVLFLLSSAAFAVAALLKAGEASVQYVLICCVALSFRLHCILNGMNYRYKKLLTEEGTRDEQHS